MDVYQMLTFEAARWIVAPFLRLHYNIKVEGQDNVPEDSGALIVANHRQPILDPMGVAYGVNRYVSFMAGAFTLDLPVIGSLYKSVGVVPVHVKGGDKAKKDLQAAADMLANGEFVAIFPEGVDTIAEPHKVAKISSFRTGFVRLAAQARVPLLPVVVVGHGEKNLPHLPAFMVKPFFDHPGFQDGVTWVTYKRMTVRIGCPLDLGELYDEEISRKMLNRLSGKVRRIIMKLYNGEDLDRFLTGEKPFDIVTDRV